MVFAFSASRSACAIIFASRKSRMKAPLHRRTEEIGACLADPFANGEGGKKRYVHHPKKGAGGGRINPEEFCRTSRTPSTPGALLLTACIIVALMHLHPDRG